MKKKLLLIASGFSAVFANAQTHLARDSSSSNNWSDYVQVPGADSKFTHSYAGAKITRAINNGRLRVSRDGTSGVNSEYTVGLVRFSIGGGTATGNFAALAPTFLKVSFKFALSGTHTGSNPLANVCFFQIGDDILNLQKIIGHE